MSQKIYGLSGDILMEAAGALAARELEMSFFPEMQKGATAIVVGPGNNGGDALVVARHLHSSGYRDLQIYSLGVKKARSQLNLLQLSRVENIGLRVVDLEEFPEKMEALLASELIVDGLFGTGLNRSIGEEFLRIIEVINKSRRPVVSLDSPSGLNSDTGGVWGAALRAKMTLTFGLAKPGFFMAEGPAHVGRLRVLPIGFPFEVLRGVANSHFVFTEKLLRRYLPRRKDRSHKGDHGRLLVGAGRSGFWGCGLLACEAALRFGVGYVTWASFKQKDDLFILESLKCPEILTAALSVETLNSNKFSAYCFGPGLGVGDNTRNLLSELIESGAQKVVLDADALRVMALHSELKPLPSWILTPHPGELADLLKVSVSEIEANRYHFALVAAEKLGCHVLLKGYRTVLASQGRVLVVPVGNSGLAKAGSGDVLTGMIGSLLAQGLDSVQAAATAAYVHGRLSEEWVQGQRDKASLCPSDLKEILPELLHRLRASGSLIRG